MQLIVSFKISFGSTATAEFKNIELKTVETSSQSNNRRKRRQAGTTSSTAETSSETTSSEGSDDAETTDDGMETKVFKGFITDLSYKYDCKFGTECDEVAETAKEPSSDVTGKMQVDLQKSARVSG